MDPHKGKVYDCRLIALNYVRTWFLIDFFSTLPIDRIATGLFPQSSTVSHKGQHVIRSQETVAVAVVLRREAQSVCCFKEGRSCRVRHFFFSIHGNEVISAVRCNIKSPRDSLI